MGHKTKDTHDRVRYGAFNRVEDLKNEAPQNLWHKQSHKR